ncbi:class I SAM-dependent methyltransferase [Labrys neptuniae]
MDGWDSSAAAWIASQGKDGDYSRAHILDAPMLERVRAGNFGQALDVGCGEGRFCRVLRDDGIAATGIDPTAALLDEARRLDPTGEYRLGRAEALPFADHSFDLVVCYLSLIDIPDIANAIAEMARVLRPGGSLLIANLTSFFSAGLPQGWSDGPAETAYFAIDRYMEERAEWAEWKGIRIRNWHRPLSTYMGLLLEQGLILRHFAEPLPIGGDPNRNAKYIRVPFFLIMEWQKPR